MSLKITSRKKKTFQDFHEAGLFSHIVATPTEQGSWRLFGICRSTNAAVFMEAARGGIREWKGLNYLADFCYSMGIGLWEVHNRIKSQRV